MLYRVLCFLEFIVMIILFAFVSSVCTLLGAGFWVSHLVHLLFGTRILLKFWQMEQSQLCRQRRRNTSVSSLHSELPIDPDNDLRDPIFSSGESTDDDSDEVLITYMCIKCEYLFFFICHFSEPASQCLSHFNITSLLWMSCVWLRKSLFELLSLMSWN